MVVEVTVCRDCSLLFVLTSLLESEISGHGKFRLPNSRQFASSTQARTNEWKDTALLVTFGHLQVERC